MLATAQQNKTKKIHRSKKINYIITLLEKRNLSCPLTTVSSQKYSLRPQTGCLIKGLSDKRLGGYGWLNEI